MLEKVIQLFHDNGVEVVGVPDIAQRRREGEIQVIANGGDAESCAFPEEIVVVSDGRHLSLREELGDGDPQRHVHRDGERVLRDEDVDVMPLDKAVEGCLQVVGHFPNAL